ncbi:MAG: ABC transporter ATP-binding protein [Acidimicrobiales bacterium]|nr:ABC transporter ATP-binding protein [Acidimicrobiales bacterium]
MEAVEVRDLVVRYGSRTAVDGLSLQAEPGRVTALLGPNGAGKTTTIETLEGYRRASAGEVRVLGLDPDRDHRALVPLIGVMLQQGGVYPAMGAAEAVSLFARYYRQPERSEALLERLGLAEVARTPFRRLSGGEQQRVSLALALVGRPRVAFLDEPTAGIDPVGRRVIRQVIRELRDSGVCVLLATHDLAEAEQLADHVVIIDRGKAVASGTPADLMAAGRGREIRFGAPAGLPTAELAQALGARVVEEQPGEYLVLAEAAPATVAALTAWLAERDLPLSDLRAGRQRLEDVFLRLVAGPS